MSMLRALSTMVGIMFGGMTILLLMMPWVYVGFDRYAHWVSTFR